MAESSGGIALKSARGYGVLWATVLGSGMAFLDGTVVNVALPTLSRELGASLQGLQWIVDGYLLTLTAFLLVGGSLGDALGRRRIYLTGVVGFAVMSTLCGLAPSLAALVAGRVLQGLAAALLVPGSLAILRGAIRPEDQDAAIGAWAGLSGVTTAAGPLLGGWLIEVGSWRAIFFLNLPLAAAVIWIARRCVPERTGERGGAIDWAGAVLAAVGLAGCVYALIEGPARGWRPLTWAAGGLGLAALAGLVIWERRAAHPMLQLRLFHSRPFSVANLTTLVLYFALSGAMFLVVLELQHGLGYSPFASSLVLAPLTLVTLVLSPLAGRLANQIGYRLLMTVGPIVAGLGMALIGAADRLGSGLPPILAGLTVFAFGLGTTVAPLTACVMTSVEGAEAGIASGVNNAVARLAGLLGVAVLPGLAGVSVSSPREAFLGAVRAALLVCAALCALGGAVSWIGLPKKEAAPLRGETRSGAARTASRRGG
jgi:EmrB/QacA subfamily drug resistance transporter